jgi:hypothetical protein
MQRRKPMKTNEAKGPTGARARADLLHHVDAISLALKNWNDTEALKLLRLHWREIAGAIRRANAGANLRPRLPAVIAVAGLQRDAAARAHDQIAQFDETIDNPANEGGDRSPSPRSFS